MIYVGSAGWNIPRAHKDKFPAEGTGLQRYAARLNAAEINSSFYRPHALAIYQRWCIFDNTGSGSAAGNALDLRALIA